jgi:hypothetical protein
VQHKIVQVYVAKVICIQSLKWSYIFHLFIPKKYIGWTLQNNSQQGVQIILPWWLIYISNSGQHNLIPRKYYYWRNCGKSAPVSCPWLQLHPYYYLGINASNLINNSTQIGIGFGISNRKTMLPFILLSVSQLHMFQKNQATHEQLQLCTFTSLSNLTWAKVIILAIRGARES